MMWVASDGIYRTRSEHLEYEGHGGFIFRWWDFIEIGNSERDIYYGAFQKHKGYKETWYDIFISFTEKNFSENM